MRRNRWQLTPREKQILDLVAAGYEYRIIAERLIIDESTVKAHVGRIMLKLDAFNNRHAVIIAFRQRLLKVEDIPEIV